MQVTHDGLPQGGTVQQVLPERREQRGGVVVALVSTTGALGFLRQ